MEIQKIFKREEIGSSSWKEASNWCNEQTAPLYTINQHEDGLYYVETYTLPSKTNQQEIAELNEFLLSTDNYALRVATGEAKETDYSSTYNCTFKEIMDKRIKARNRINELEKVNE